MSRTEDALGAARDGLSLVSLALPHLSGLARRATISASDRVRTACVFASGRIVINPAWFLRLDRDGATFVLAHELLHLALGTHARGTGADPAIVNRAHDYIINDMLSAELEMEIPAGGLEYRGARNLSLEAMIARLGSPGAASSWASVGSGIFAGALSKAGLLPPDLLPLDPQGDVLSAEDERRLFPDLDPRAQLAAIEHTVQEARKALGLHAMRGAIAGAQGGGTSGHDASAAWTEALASAYRAPWELAIQRWIEALSPGPRTYARPSRRDGGRTDVVLAGRAREGWALHVILDTSGSMLGELPQLLDIIARFAEAAGVEQIHVVQCDTGVTRDQWVSPDAFAKFELAGFGGSDLSPAIELLAGDEIVEAAVIITDGCITYPDDPPPYEVLWAVTAKGFYPKYGRAIEVELNR